MAIVNIPFGGQTVGIEIPDFALETTQQDIKELMSDQLQAIRNMSADSSQTDDAIKNLAKEIGRKNNNDIVDQLKKNKDDQSRTSRALESSFNAFESTFKKTDLSSQIDTLISAIPVEGAAMIGGALGTLVGVTEKLAAGLSKTMRVGVGVNESFEDMIESSTMAGMTFDNFAAILLANGSMLRNFGDTTGEASRNLAATSQEFRRLTQAQGHYGMSNEEMTSLLIEESEVMRQSLGMQRLANMSMNEFAASVQENMDLQTALAAITGQDVQERLNAQRAAVTSTIAMDVLSGSSDELFEKFRALGASLSMVDPSNQLYEAFVASYGTGRPIESFLGSLAPLAGEPLMDFFDTVSRNLSDNIDTQNFSATVVSALGGLRGLGDTLDNRLLYSMQAGGDANAEFILRTRNLVRELGTQEEIMAELNTMLDEQTGTLARGDNSRVAGMSSALSDLTAEINQTILELASIFIPGDANSAGGALVEGLRLTTRVIDNAAGILGPALSILVNSFLGATGAGSGATDALNDLFGLNMQQPFDAVEQSTIELRDNALDILRGILTPDVFAAIEERFRFSGEPEPDTTDTVPASPTSRSDTATPTSAQPISYTPDDFRSAIIDAFDSIMRNGGLPVDVRNFNQMPVPRRADGTTA